MRFELHAVAERALREHARLAFPREACGLLARSSAGAQHYLPMTNTAGANTRFEMDPVEFVRREQELREAGLWICGFFHSHPHGPARPSSADIAAAWPRQVQLILAMGSGEASQLTAWYNARRNGLRQIPVSVTCGSPPTRPRR